MEQYDKAVSVFQEVLKSNPSDLKAIYNLANSYDMSGQYDLAAPLYRKLIEINPNELLSSSLIMLLLITI